MCTNMENQNNHRYAALSYWLSDVFRWTGLLHLTQISYINFNTIWKIRAVKRWPGHDPRPERDQTVTKQKRQEALERKCSVALMWLRQITWTQPLIKQNPDCWYKALYRAEMDSSFIFTCYFSIKRYNLYFKNLSQKLCFVSRFYEWSKYLWCRWWQQSRWRLKCWSWTAS